MKILTAALFLQISCVFAEPPERVPSATEGEIGKGGKFVPAAGNAKSDVTSEKELAAKVAVRRVSDDEYAIGELRINKALRTISLPARVEVKTGQIEYALVHSQGKVHEALFSTDISPEIMHLAAVLLRGVDQVPVLEVTWKKHGPNVRVPLATLIEIKEVDSTLLTSGEWTYNGSDFGADGFAAQREGSMIALMPDPTALVNHRAATDLKRDDVFLAHTKKLPAKSTPITLILTFPKLLAKSSTK